MTTLIAHNQSSIIKTRPIKDELWIHADDVHKSTGFEIKPSGVCYSKLDICIPLLDQGYTFEDEKGLWLNLSKLANTLDMACVSNTDKTVWSLGIIPQERTKLLETGMAPDFEIEDIHGNTIKRSDFLGKKILIVTWATWCGCRFDVKSWQKLYEELNQPNFEIICVAQDAQGDQVAKKWFLEAKATFHCIVDTKHKISSVFGWVNVPTGCWIDEKGKIVRVNEAAYAEKHQIKNWMMKTEFGNEAFGNATKEWVKNGLTAKIFQSETKQRANIKAQSLDDFKADAWFQLGLHFQDKKNTTEAEKYFEIARNLAPNNWNIQRQSWTFKSTFFAIKNWNRITRSKMNTNKDWTYYEPIDLEGAPTRRTTRIVWFWERLGQWCKQRLGL